MDVLKINDDDDVITTSRSHDILHPIGLKGKFRSLLHSGCTPLGEC